MKSPILSATSLSPAAWDLGTLEPGFHRFTDSGMLEDRD